MEATQFLDLNNGKLLKSQKECDDLKEELARSKENEIRSNARENRALERYNNFFEEQLKVINDKDEIIANLYDKLSSQALEINAIKEKNSQLFEELRGRIVFLEKEKKKSDQEFQEMKKKKMEAEKAMDELSRKKVEAFRTIEEFKVLVGAVDQDFEVRNRIWGVFKDKVHGLGETVVEKGCGYLHPMTKLINEGGGKGDGSAGQAVSQTSNALPQVEADCSDLEKETERSLGVEVPVQEADSDGEAIPEEDNSDSPANLAGKGNINDLPSVDGSPGQAVLQSPNCSPRVEANCIDFEKGTESTPVAEAPVHVGDSDVEAIIAELDNGSDSPSILAEKEKTNDLPSPKLPLSLIASTLRRKKGTHDNIVQYLRKGKKKEQAQKPSRKRKQSTSLNLSKTPNPSLKRCKKKTAVVSDSQVQILNIDSSTWRRCVEKPAEGSDSHIPIWNVDSSSSEDSLDDIVRS